MNATTTTRMGRWAILAAHVVNDPTLWRPLTGLTDAHVRRAYDATDLHVDAHAYPVRHPGVSLAALSRLRDALGAPDLTSAARIWSGTLVPATRLWTEVAIAHAAAVEAGAGRDTDPPP